MATEAGGWSPSHHPVSSQLKEVILRFKAEAEKTIGHEFHEFVPISYRTQIVEGTRYLVAVQIAQNYHFTIEIELLEDLKGQFKYITATTLYTK